MKRAFALLLIVGALSAGSLIAQAHGPGGGLLWSGKPWSGNLHCHSTGATFEIYASSGSNAAGIGIIGLPAPTGGYVISPVGQNGTTIKGPSATNQNACADSIIP